MAPCYRNEFLGATISWPRKSRSSQVLKNMWLIMDGYWMSKHLMSSDYAVNKHLAIEPPLDVSVPSLNVEMRTSNPSGISGTNSSSPETRMCLSSRPHSSEGRVLLENYGLFISTTSTSDSLACSSSCSSSSSRGSLSVPNTKEQVSWSRNQ